MVMFCVHRGDTISTQWRRNFAISDTKKKILLRNRKEVSIFHSHNFTPLTARTHTHHTDGTRWQMDLNFIAPLWQHVVGVSYTIAADSSFFRARMSRDNMTNSTKKLLHFKFSVHFICRVPNGDSITLIDREKWIRFSGVNDFLENVHFIQINLHYERKSANSVY